jgi:hypothetical protein
MRNAELLCDSPRIVDVAAGAAGALAMDGSAMIVKLQGDADDVIAFRRPTLRPRPACSSARP